MAERLAGLKGGAKQAGIPAVYVNDNFGKWRSDFTAILEHCLGDGVRGRPIAELLRPEEDDYFVLKPKHSGFFSTALDTLLDYLRATTLVLTGLTSDNCVLFTASDAYIRDFDLIVPADCVASIEAEDNARALGHMQKVLRVDTTISTALDLPALVRRVHRPSA
jgi:nicotinamidase-related amidase